MDPIDRFVTGLGDEIEDHLRDYIEWFAAQVIILAFVTGFVHGLGGIVLSVLVNIGFLVFTGCGLLQEIGDVISAKSVLRLVLAIFVFIFDIWLNITIH